MKRPSAQLNRGSPHFRNLRNLWIPGGPNTFRDPVGLSAPATTGSPIVTEHPQIGKVWRSTSSADYVDVGALSILNGAAWTIAGWWEQSTDAGRSILFGSNGSAGARQVAYSWNTPGALSIGEENVSYIATGPPLDLGLHHIVWVYSGGSHELYVDAKLHAWNSYTFSGSFSGSYLIAQSIAGEIRNYGAWSLYDRALSVPEIWSLYDPRTRWSLYQQPKVWSIGDVTYSPPAPSGTVIFYDTFVESSDTALASHTPNIGTSWTILEQSGTPTMEVQGTTDQAKATSNAASERISYTADATYPGADYDVIAMAGAISATDDDPVVLLGRVTDSNNFYGLQYYRANASPSFRLFKKVAGAFTELDTDDTASLPAVNSYLKLEMRGTAIKGYIDSGSGYTLILSATDSSLTSAGKAGLGTGNIFNSGAGATDDINTANRVDNFQVVDYSATAYSISAEAGSFAISGTAATLKLGTVVSAGAGSFTISGTAATLKLGTVVSAGAGSFTISGTAATLKLGTVVSAGAGSFTVTGTDASLLYSQGYQILAEAGTFAFTGTDAAVSLARLVSAAAGSYAISGADATLRNGRVLSLESGAFLVSGATATLKATRLLAPDSGAYTYSGTAASLLRQFPLVVDSGSYAVLGTSASLYVGRSVACEIGGFAIAGTAADFIYSGLNIVAGPYSVAASEIANAGQRSGHVHSAGTVVGQIH